MVQAKEVDRQIILWCQFQHILNEHFHANGDVTDTNEFLEFGMAEYGFCDHTRWVSKVNHPRVRADFFHIFNDVKNNRDRTQPFE